MRAQDHSGGSGGTQQEKIFKIRMLRLAENEFHKIKFPDFPWLFPFASKFPDIPGIPGYWTPCKLQAGMVNVSSVMSTKDYIIDFLFNFE